MRFKLEIQCDNAAFDPDPRPELERLLRRIADDVGAMVAGRPWVLLDVNGNRIGATVLIEEHESGYCRECGVWPDGKQWGEPCPYCGSSLQAADLC